MSKKKPAAATIAEIEPYINQYLKLRQYKERREEELKNELQKYTEAIAVLNNYLTVALLKNKIDSVSVAAGTAYTSEPVKYTVADKRAYITWLLQQNDPDIWDTVDLKPNAKETDARAQRILDERIQAGVIKEGEPLERFFNELLPAGVNRTSVVMLSVRKKGKS